MFGGSSFGAAGADGCAGSVEVVGVVATVVDTAIGVVVAIAGVTVPANRLVGVMAKIGGRT